MTTNRKIFFSIILIFISYFFYSYTSESTKYVIINEIAKDDKWYLYEVCSKPNKIEIFDNNLEDFSFSEQLSVNMQKITQTNSELKSNKIKYLDRRQNKMVFSKIVFDCNKEYNTVYKISMPIVSPDTKTVLIKITEDCNCMLGGQSGTYLFKKINNKWKRIKSLGGWIG